MEIEEDIMLIQQEEIKEHSIYREQLQEDIVNDQLTLKEYYNPF